MFIIAGAPADAELHPPLPPKAPGDRSGDSLSAFPPPASLLEGLMTSARDAIRRIAGNLQLDRSPTAAKRLFLVDCGPRSNSMRTTAVPRALRRICAVNDMPDDAVHAALSPSFRLF